VVLHALTQGGVGGGVGLWHEEQTGANVETVTILEKFVQASAGNGVLFEDGDVISSVGQSPSNGDAADACPDHKYRGHKRASFAI
jgi:hypothetical protein